MTCPARHEVLGFTCLDDEPHTTVHHQLVSTPSGQVNHFYWLAPRVVS